MLMLHIISWSAFQPDIRSLQIPPEDRILIINFFEMENLKRKIKFFCLETFQLETSQSSFAVREFPEEWKRRRIFLAVHYWLDQ